MSDQPMCFICERMMSRPSSAQRVILSHPDELQHCLLCNRIFCATHKAVENNTICEINHQSYFRNHPQLHGTGTIFRNMEHRNIEMDPSNAGLDRAKKVMMEREAIKQRVEEEKGGSKKRLREKGQARNLQTMSKLGSEGRLSGHYCLRCNLQLGGS
ncbi:uncharacterized protein EAF02_005623 [Botrytis sinoallii]|uniref:uncharacterized protein n=1 Tax=Botrytis sinoallii TaxID=1463999 RepID=UPI001900CD32|nr:uncharacterized protein EAF02_005623 [Botrytis sinoallii]KAF7883703.1 hypothetical protein EAF02_005623 [Botrytis sinoallii]